MLSGENRITKSLDFNYIYKNGFKVRGEYGMLIGVVSRESPSSSPRFGFVISKKIGIAVKRNKMARRLRAVTHETIKSYEGRLRGLDFSYVAFKYADNYEALKGEFVEQLENILKKFKSR